MVKKYHAITADICEMSLQRFLLTLVFIVIGIEGSYSKKPCEEDNTMCQQYSDITLYCHHAIIKQKCKKACGLCKDDPKVIAKKVCKTDDHARCGLYENKAYYCKQSWMKENCCNHCSKKDKPSSKSSDVSSVVGAIVAQPSFQIVSKICRKRDLPMCERYMQSGREHYCTHHMIRKHCKKACGVCVDEYTAAQNSPAGLMVLGRSCPRPDIPMCAYYLQMGKAHYCQQSYMKAYCGKACGYC